MNKIIESITKDYKKNDIPDFNTGDTIKVYVKVVEGEKERIQTFEGIVIKRKGSDINETFTVRRISYGISVERIFPIHSPNIEKIDIVNKGKVRRSKINYLKKNKIGKSMKIKNFKNKSTK